MVIEGYDEVVERRGLIDSKVITNLAYIIKIND